MGLTWWEGKLCRSERRAGEEHSLDARSPSANIWIRAGAFDMGLTWWVATTRKDGPSCQSRSKTGGGRLWKRRSVGKSFGLSHLAWESRPNRGIPTFPQSRRRRSLNLKPDISCTQKSGHFNLLTTGTARVADDLCLPCPFGHWVTDR